MENYFFKTDITYENYESVISDLKKQFADMESVVIVPAGRMSTLKKAAIRELALEFDHVSVDSDLSGEIFYPEKKEEKKEKAAEGVLEKLGGNLLAFRDRMAFFFIIMVDMIHYSIQFIWNRKFIVKNDILKNSFHIGYRAVPIVMLLSFLIGLVITVQAAAQMVKFGGQGYLAMLIGYAMFKELGPLVTAIIISGRTGSSIAAEIGTMVVMEEVDALTTMGIKPLKFLLVPKFWAFTLSMPILTLFADIAGVTGGLIIGTIYNVPPASFMSEIVDIISMKDFLWGTVKSLSFAWTILAVASYKGLNVRGGSDAVGRATTDSVVVSIFLVVVIDAVYSIFLYML